MRTAYSRCPNFRKTDVVELSLLVQFIEHLRIMFNLVVRVASRRLKEVELLLPIQSFDDSIDAPAQILPAPVYVQFPRNASALDGKESAIRVLWVLLEEASDELEIRNGAALSVELA